MAHQHPPQPSPLPSLLPLGQGPRVVVYHQTIHQHGKHVSLLPLITNQTGVTHVIIAAIHLNEGPGNITLNDDPPEAEKYQQLWSEAAWLKASGVPVLGMLGGAAKGTFARLDGDDASVSRPLSLTYSCARQSPFSLLPLSPYHASPCSLSPQFHAYYTPLATLIQRHSLSGLDLDIEEPMSLRGAVRLIDRLRTDFGPNFLITLAPVATALLPQQPHLSGFSYFELERVRGGSVAWYNTQFYCGWGDASNTAHYDAVVACGWRPEKVVMGLITNPALGAGHVEPGRMQDVLRVLRARYPGFGGVMGWEYFCARPGEHERPWEWARDVARCVRSVLPPGRVDGGRGVEAPGIVPGLPPPVPGGHPGSLPLPQHPFPQRDVGFLTELGFSSRQAVAALNMTGGNVDLAAGLLFED
ncbi:hypothetical protein M8818_001313 [Zalaria obscura]|uniref:Uncharacterized protein n=1 Tax=Zalaria obscura TaxID=2024903 RepID=A0ACC3SLG0_9PEZI